MEKRKSRPERKERRKEGKIERKRNERKYLVSHNKSMRVFLVCLLSV